MSGRTSEPGGSARTYTVAAVLAACGVLALAVVSLLLIFPDRSVSPSGNAEQGTPARFQPLQPRVPRAVGSGVRRGRLPEVPGPDGDEAGRDGEGRGLDAASEELLREARRNARAGRWIRATAAYDRLRDAHPDVFWLGLERARVLSWSGATDAVAGAFRTLAGKRPRDATLHVEAARHVWWAGHPALADSLLETALRTAPGSPQARELRREVRRSMEVPVATALRWVREDGAPANHLALARAYVREDRPAEALASYRRARAAGDGAPPGDLEMAGAAWAADSTALVVDLLERHLERHPGSAEVELALARAYADRERYPAALRLYDRLLSREPGRGAEEPRRLAGAGGPWVAEAWPDAASGAPAIPGTTELRFERARVVVRSGREGRAAAELYGLLEADPRHAAAHRLLGDLARWRGARMLAVHHYLEAALLDPDVEGLGEALAAAREPDAAEGTESPDPVDRPRERSTVTVAGFGDSEGFRWLSVRAGRSWESDASRLRLGVRRDRAASSRAEGTPALPRDGAVGLGASVEVERDLGGGGRGVSDGDPGRGATVGGALGVRRFDAAGTFPTWAAWIGIEGDGAPRLSLRYRRAPAVRRAATLASLQAGATSDLVRLTVAAPAGAWSLWSSWEIERLAAGEAGAKRAAGTVSATRPLTGGLTVGLHATGITASGDGSVGSGGEERHALFWTPDHYLAAGPALRYRGRIGEGWSLEGRIAPGYALSREGRDELRRYGSEAIPVADAGLEAGYRSGAWRLGLSAGWRGVLGSGYASRQLLLETRYALPR